MNANTHPPPRTDDDTSEVIDDTVSVLAERRGLWLGNDATVVHLLASLIAQCERELPLAVTMARGEGCSWDDIAQLLGTSAHEARLRFDPDSPVADGRWPFDID
jgi:DNA-directed RNA polymerase specialized sigma24 family protein